MLVQEKKTGKLSSLCKQNTSKNAHFCSYIRYLLVTEETFYNIHNTRAYSLSGGLVYSDEVRNPPHKHIPCVPN